MALDVCLAEGLMPAQVLRAATMGHMCAEERSVAATGHSIQEVACPAYSTQRSLSALSAQSIRSLV